MAQSSSLPVTIELYPYRSLSRNGFIMLMGSIALVSMIAGIAFLLMGAWPVFGFFGLDVLLLWWALDRNFKDARIRERIRICEREILVTRVGVGVPERRLSFPRPWARIVLEEDLRRDLIGRLLLTSRGMTTEVGSFLAPDDRRSLAHHLDEILARPK
jgi:uncharacterized membrane protein